MTPENGFREPGIDYSAWVASPVTEKIPKRWCPSHRKWESNPAGRLRCGPAWAEQYELEREVDAEMMHPNSALIKLAESIGELVEEIRIGGVITEPPTKPQRPVPPAPPIPPRPNTSAGRGGVELP